MSIEDELLARFGRNIDLPAYLQSRGYELAPDSPADARDIRMAHPKGQLIAVAQSPDTGGWTYANLADPSDRGTVVDYLQRHERLTPSAALTRVTACLDVLRRDVPEASAYRTALAHKPDPLRRAEHDHRVTTNNRTTAVRALSRAGLTDRSIDESRLGPIKGLNDFARLVNEPVAGDLWASRYKATDRRLVISERPIDALGWAQDRRDPNCACLAVSSLLDSDQRKRLAHVLGAIPPGMSVVLATANSPRGRQLADEIQALAPMLRMERQPPSLPGRWGDHLQLARVHEASLHQRGLPLTR